MLETPQQTVEDSVAPFKTKTPVMNTLMSCVINENNQGRQRILKLSGN